MQDPLPFDLDDLEVVPGTPPVTALPSLEDPLAPDPVFTPVRDDDGIGCPRRDGDEQSGQ